MLLYVKLTEKTNLEKQFTNLIFSFTFDGVIFRFDRRAFQVTHGNRCVYLKSILFIVICLTRAGGRASIVIFHHSAYFSLIHTLWLFHVDFWVLGSVVSAAVYINPYISNQTNDNQFPIWSKILLYNYTRRLLFDCPDKKNNWMLGNCIRNDKKDWRKWTSLRFKWNLVEKQWRNTANKLYVCFKFVFEVSLF